MKIRISNFIKSLTVLFFVLLTANYYLVFTSFAATPTPSPKASPIPSQNIISSDSADLERIQRIKDIVASKVAELNLVEKRGILGKVIETSTTQAVIQDIKGNRRIIDIDELTKFASSDRNKKSFGVSDLEKGVNYSFVGLYNKDTKKLLARSVSEIKTIPIYFEGAVSSINSEGFEIEVINGKGEKRKVDIERSTKTNLFSVNGDLQKSGFSKISVNERVLVVGFLDQEDSSLISSSRVIHFPNVPPSKEMQSFVDVASTSAKAK